MTNAELWELQRRAKHEALHAMLGTRAGGTVDIIHIEPEAFTVLRYPLHPSALSYQHRHFPNATRHQTIKILAGIVAPYVVTDTEVLEGSDRELLEKWLHAWDVLPGAISVRELRANATQYAREWYQQRHAWVDNVMHALVQRRKIWWHPWWLQILQSCRPPDTRPCTVTIPSWPAAERQRALSNSIRVEDLLCLPDWRTSRYAGAGLVQLW